MTSCIVSLPAAVPGAVHAAQDDGGAPDFLAAIAHGRPLFELRPRYNDIAEADKPARTGVWTYRATAGWITAPWHDARVLLEGIHADHYGRDNVDAASNAEYPLLPNPRHTGVNRAFVEIEKETVRARVGRQPVRLANGRWVSEDDFRQVPRLFDGASVTWDVAEGIEVSAQHYRRVRTTSGSLEDLRLTVASAAWNPAPGHALLAYAVFHDQPENDSETGFANNSYRVAGLRFEGALKSGALAFPYEAEAAQQKAYAGGDGRIDARYLRAGAGVAWRSLAVRADYERKGSNGGLYGLQMPLTDFYAFNGWALSFFHTPPQGLDDRWATARYAIGPFAFFAAAHRFRSAFGALDFGRETDLGVTYGLREDTTLRLQHARYAPGAAGPEPRVQKTWLTLTWGY